MTSTLQLENPIPFLESMNGKHIVVRLKWGWQLKGLLQSRDPYMNLLLLHTEQWVNGENRGELGEVLIRCNNILYIRPAPEEN